MSPYAEVPAGTLPTGAPTISISKVRCHLCTAANCTRDFVQHRDPQTVRHPGKMVTTTLAIVEDSDQFIATRLRGCPPHLHLVIPIDAPVAIHIQPHWTHELSTTALPGFLFGEFFTFIKTVDGVVAITQIDASMDILPNAIQQPEVIVGARVRAFLPMLRYQNSNFNGRIGGRRSQRAEELSLTSGRLH